LGQRSGEIAGLDAGTLDAAAARYLADLHALALISATRPAN
jgi:hypothetical protein